MCIWDVRAGKCVQRIDDYNSELNSVKFFPTGNAIATAATDGSVREREKNIKNNLMMIL